MHQVWRELLDGYSLSMIDDSFSDCQRYRSVRGTHVGLLFTMLFKPMGYAENEFHILISPLDAFHNT